MSNIKQAPFLGLTGMGGGGTGLALGGAVAKKSYIDDVYSTYLYRGNGSGNRDILSYIDMTSDGGFVWTKNRDNGSYGHNVFDTVRGAAKMLITNTTATEANEGNTLTHFTSGGFKIGGDNNINKNNEDYASWNFRRAPGFFDVVKYTGGSGTQTISHNLGCIPGMIVVKALDTTDNWAVFHRGMDSTNPNNYGMKLNTDGARFTGAGWNVTATTFDAAFSLTNNDGKDFIAYLFAGGESDAATARSVDFSSSSYLSIPDHVYPGDGDNNGNWTFWSNPFTIEMWVKSPDAHSGYESLVGQWGSSQRNWVVRYSSADVGSNWSFFYSSTGSNYFSIDGGAKIDDNQWHHIAVVRTGGSPNLFKLYTDGKLTGGTTSHSNIALHNSTTPLRIGSDNDNNHFTGTISNLRIIRNLAHYTSDFKVPTAPLTDTGQSGSNVSGTVLLCCNNSSVTGSSFTSGTISSNGSYVTANSNSPFDDPDAFIFGEEGDQNIVKMGSYTGNGSSSSPPKIYLGWEPQWVMVKRSNGSGQDWVMVDTMRGMYSAGSPTPHLRANSANSEQDTTYYRIDVSSSRGFSPVTTDNGLNGNGDEYIYMAVRRPDPFVAKPAEAATDVFAIDTGDGNSTIPNFDSGFPVDFALQRPLSMGYTGAYARLLGHHVLYTATNGAEQDESSGQSEFDSNLGWGASSDFQTSTTQSYMWKRSAGFDVLAYQGDAKIGRVVFHNLSKSPEMIWIKKRDASEPWAVGHKGLNGGTNPWEYYLQLESNIAEADYPLFNDQAPSSTSFHIHSNDMVNGEDHPYIAMLFASVSGISRVGYYNGSGSTGNAQNIGFQPRYLIIKRINSTGNWMQFNSLSGFDKYTQLDTNQQQYTQTYVNVSATGFSLVSDYGDTNESGSKYIYYAHA
jgi:hypothetical protein